MRTTIYRGMLGGVCCAAVFCFAAAYMDRHPDSVLTHSWQLARHAVVRWLGKMANEPTLLGIDGSGLEQICAPEEPHAVDTLLPDPAKLTADWQPFETINVLENGNKQVPCDAVPGTPCPEKRELLPVMPRPDTTADAQADRSAGEEQEEAGSGLTADPRAVQERLMHILHSYLPQANGPTGVAVDTMEFRPSDAKKGEFDRISF
jgi:hypothetical protein